MTLKVIKVAELVGTQIIISGKIGRQTFGNFTAGDFVAMLTNFDAADQPGPAWELPLDIGVGPTARRVMITLNQFLTSAQFEKSKVDPIIVCPVPPTPKYDPFTFFRGRFFWLERRPITSAEREEVILRTKKAVYDEEAEITSIRAAVSNIEAAIEYQKNGPVREPISDDVKMLVWSRDSGACVRCGSKERLQFDHIIPVAKGGSNDADNIQLLCQACNLRKSDKIAF